MICSLQRIDFIDPSGRSTRLLDYGDFIAEEIAWPVEQSSTTTAPIYSRWGTPFAMGGGLSEVQWQRRTKHQSHEAVRAWCMRHPAMMPLGITGTLVVSIEFGEVWHFQDSVLLSCISQPHFTPTNPGFRSVNSYRVQCGKRIPAENVRGYPVMPMGWDLLTFSESTILHSDPTRVSISGTLTPPLPALLPDLFAADAPSFLGLRVWTSDGLAPSDHSAGFPRVTLTPFFSGYVLLYFASTASATAEWYGSGGFPNPAASTWTPGDGATGVPVLTLHP